MKTKNLTIQEAIQSGLPFKRPDWVQFITDLQIKAMVTNSDILANDYMLEQKEVTITREKLAEAFCYVYGENALIASNNFIKLAKELGL